MNPLFKARGFSLAELMVALLLGGIVSMGVVQLWSMVKRTLAHQEALMHIQETMQTSFFMMGQAIRSAGNMGCIKWQDAKSVMMADDISLADIGLADNQVIRITNKEQLKNHPLIPRSTIGEIKPYTDVLWIVSSELNSQEWKPGDILIQADCAKIALNKSSENHPGCRRLTSTLYYVSKSNNLYFKELNRNATGQLEGVEDLKMVLTPKGVRIQFGFVYLNTHLTWEREWAVR